MVKGSTASGRILVVDDQPANLRVVGTLLSRNGYEVLDAGDGEQALRIATEQLPDLILLDVLMPGMDGFQVLAEIKQRDTLMRLPVVCLTAARDREQLLRAFDAGAVDYVTKPFLPEELLARVSAHIGLKLTRDRLERVARERQELVNLVAHDLKNPLSSVLFAVDMLRAGEVREDRVPRYLETINDSANDALGYIRRYLETQRAARDEPAAAVAPLSDVLGWLERRYALQFEARDRRLSVSAPNDAMAVAIDPLVLRQVAENLVTNAMKYAPHSDLEIGCRRGADGFLQLVFEDRGPGIPAAKQRQLFQPFVRLQGGQPAPGDMSSGLGLSLAKQIVGEAGGQLWYEDRDGGGARFVIELPEARLPA
ncbi:hybrid sensor histidine kinase/response regulator [Luteimonas sp. RD2P54]|uniref:histidine kinase n=1 Tax=Luteimonas endophytica TaxID=3042023 RepID=A0ABT6J6X3_9GAMM|nr:hybrid sensor histidine kinase/response regulator [Luteimonas endophytica]MDH5822584.1 hybrid sensor histidine kinase/response regulator [Luteimonas endophytica]